MLTRVRLQAPREDHSALIEPPWDVLAGLPASNRAARQTCRGQVLGRSFREFSAAARRELVRGAFLYTRGMPPPENAHEMPIVMGGHQPELFHPGVWFKNFALDALAKQHRALAINLIIDSDTLRAPSLRVPGGSVDSPTLRAIAFDAPGPEVPFEERQILDHDMFASFGERVAAEIAPLVPDPLIRRLWPLVVQNMPGHTAGYCIARGRHLLEESWGVQLLEIPQSLVCRTSAFHWFAAHLLLELPRLWEAYNDAVAEFRRVNRVRSANHPVPDLARQDEWLEAPFWLWSKDDPRRRRAFVRRQGDALILSDRNAIECKLPAGGDPARLVESLAAIAEEPQGIRLRTRALVTTLFGRMFLSDLFLHGIGGAKYDQVTDAIGRRFFGCAPPRFGTLSATLRLPIDCDRSSRPREPSGAECRSARGTYESSGAECRSARGTYEPPLSATVDLRLLDQRLRELEFHPERWLDAAGNSPAESSQVEQLVADKRRWIETPATRETAKARCHAIRAANQSLQQFVQPLRSNWRLQRQHAASRAAAEAIFSSREFSFCLFPEQTLRDFLLEFRFARP